MPIFGGIVPIAESTPFFIVLAEEYTPIIAAAVVTVVLARQGWASKMQEYRKDTLDLIRLRAETLEKELADAHVEIQDLMRDLRTRDRRIEALEDEMDALRAGSSRRPPRRPPRTPERPEPPPPLHAPDVDDPHA
jgi:hypothetical protein